MSNRGGRGGLEGISRGGRGGGEGEGHVTNATQEHGVQRCCDTKVPEGLHQYAGCCGQGGLRFPRSHGAGPTRAVRGAATAQGCCQTPLRTFSTQGFRTMGEPKMEHWVGVEWGPSVTCGTAGAFFSIDHATICHFSCHNLTVPTPSCFIFDSDHHPSLLKPEGGPPAAVC